MKNYSISTLVALLLLSGSVYGQIKDQYTDEKDALTTVVVKEDAANDMDILNDQFDLDEVGMHQVIRITTREELPAPAPEETMSVQNPTKVTSSKASIPESAPTPTPSSEEPIVTKSPVFVEATQEEIAPELMTASVDDLSPQAVVNTTASTDAEDEPTSATTSETSTPSATAVTAPVPAINKKNTVKSAVRSNSKSSYSRSNKTKFKAFNKRFKKKKRKRRVNKRKRNRKCYRF